MCQEIWNEVLQRIYLSVHMNAPESYKFATLWFLVGKLVNSTYLFIKCLDNLLIFCSIVPLQIRLNKTNISCVYKYIDKVSKKVFLKVIKRKNRFVKGTFYSCHYFGYHIQNDKLPQISHDYEVCIVFTRCTTV